MLSYESYKLKSIIGDLKKGRENEERKYRIWSTIESEINFSDNEVNLLTYVFQINDVEKIIFRNVASTPKRCSRFYFKTYSKSRHTTFFKLTTRINHFKKKLSLISVEDHAVITAVFERCGSKSRHSTFTISKGDAYSRSKGL